MFFFSVHSSQPAGERPTESSKTVGLIRAEGAIFFSFPRKSYCLIWESWGKIQLHTEGKTTEEETPQLISPSQLLAPIRDKREWIKASFIKARVSQKKEHHLVERGVSLHFPSAGHLFFFAVCFLRSSGSLQGAFIPASRRSVTTFRAKSADVIAVHNDFPLCDLSFYAANNNKSGGKPMSISFHPDYGC